MERKNERIPIFTERFRELQGKQSNTEFAEFLGISRQTVGFYWNGDRVPDAITLTKISQKCDVSVDWLLGISDAKSRDVDIQRICQKTGLDENIVKYLIELSSSDNGQTVLNYRLFYLSDSSFMGIFNEVFQSENIQDLVNACATYLRFVQRIEREIEDTEYYLENPEEIKYLDLHYGRSGDYEDEMELFKSDSESRFLHISRENKLSRIEGMEVFSGIFDKFHKKYSAKLELEVQKMLEKLNP